MLSTFFSLILIDYIKSFSFLAKLVKIALTLLFKLNKVNIKSFCKFIKYWMLNRYLMKMSIFLYNIVINIKIVKTNIGF